MNRCGAVVGLSSLAVWACGCSATSAVKWGVKLVGDAVTHADVDTREQELQGQPPAAADAMFGERIDVLRDTRTSRQWIIYPVPLDLLKQYRYVVGVTDNRILSLTKVKKGGDSKLDIPRKLIFEEKVKGKSPAACEASLDLGPPLLTVKSDRSGRLSQLYRAQRIEIEGITKPHYCVLRFDDQGRCADVELVSAEAKAGGEGGP